MNAEWFHFPHLLNFSPTFHLQILVPLPLDAQVQTRRVTTVFTLTLKVHISETSPQQQTKKLRITHSYLL